MCSKDRTKHTKAPLFFHRACCYRTLSKNPTHALCFKIHTKTQSFFKTLECPRLLCHSTSFGHRLDHLQGMFLVQCYFPRCCFVTNFTWVCGRIFYLCCCHVYLSAVGLVVYWRWSSMWPKHVGWHNRRRHSNVLKNDCVLVCILKHSAWVGFLDKVR